jgi:hypothetical protein
LFESEFCVLVVVRNPSSPPVGFEVSLQLFSDLIRILVRLSKLVEALLGSRDKIPDTRRNCI